MKRVQRAAIGCIVCLVAVLASTASAADAAKGTQPAPQAAPAMPPQGAMTTDAMKASAKERADARAAAMRNEPKVDINNASKAEIQKVLGVSAADAGRIVAARPLRSKTEIVTKAGLPEGVYHATRSRIIINEPRKPAPKQ